MKATEAIKNLGTGNVFMRKIPMRKPNSYWPKKALNENISQGPKSPYTRYLLKWKEATNCFGLHPKQIRATVTRAAIIDILDTQRQT